MSRKKAEALGSMLPLPLQFLAAWLGCGSRAPHKSRSTTSLPRIKILKEKLGGRKLGPTGADRRRLAVLGKELGRKLLATVVDNQLVSTC